MPNFTKLSTENLTEILPFFKSKPKFALFYNAAKFQLENRLPSHPSDFYVFEAKETKYFYVFRHDNIPDNYRPILMIGNEGVIEERDVIQGLEEISKMEPNLKNIDLLLAKDQLAYAAQKFYISHFNLSSDFTISNHNFYLSPEVSPEVQAKIEGYSIPEGFSIGSTKMSDAIFVNDSWKFGTPDTILQTRELIQRLPTACITHKNQPVSFEMIGLHGQLCHQYTYPEYRNRGFGALVENTIISKCISEGMQVVKSVERENKIVLKRSMAHPWWQIVRDDDGEPIVYDCVEYHLDKQKSEIE